MEEFQDVLRSLEININLKYVKREDDIIEKEIVNFVIDEQDDYTEYNETYDMFCQDKYKV